MAASDFCTSCIIGYGYLLPDATPDLRVNRGNAQISQFPARDLRTYMSSLTPSSPADGWPSIAAAGVAFDKIKSLGARDKPDVSVLHSSVRTLRCRRFTGNLAVTRARLAG